MASDLPGSLAEALVALQADLPRITKDATADVPGKDGKRGYSYSYADLATVSRIILPRLAAVGLCFTARPTIRATGGPVLLYSLMHVGGDEISGEYPLPSSPGTPQAFGGAITYARRYALLAVTGVAPDDDDDDGQAATEEARALQRRPPETDAHGAATFAEQTRMVTGPVPGTTRHTGTAGERSEWDSTADTTAEQVRQSRLRQMFASYRELDVTGKDEMLADLSAILGRPIESRKDISLSELTTVCAILRRRAEARQPAEATR